MTNFEKVRFIDKAFWKRMHGLSFQEVKESLEKYDDFVIEVLYNDLMEKIDLEMIQKYIEIMKKCLYDSKSASRFLNQWKSDLKKI